MDKDKTSDKVLQVINDLELKGYKLKRSHENFIIWQLEDKPRYIRLCLISTGWHEEKSYYWNLELDFRPFKYEHNQKQNKYTSEKFKPNEEERYFNYFLNMIDRIQGCRGG